MAKTAKKTTFGLIVGNRAFFPDQLAKEGRQAMIKVLNEQGYDVVALTPRDSKYGSVETLQDARKCAELFAGKADLIDGIIVTLPNFGDEKAVAEAIKRSGLEVPVLVHAFSDEPDQMDIRRRRDAFCGKVSVCNNLRQYGIAFTLTTRHTDQPTSPSFLKDLAAFAVTCRVVRALKHARFGAVGARPAAFNTCRYSEKLLQSAGIDIETVDLSEIFGQAWKLKDTDPKVRARVNAIKKYIAADSVPAEALSKLARFGIVLDRWIEENDLSGIAVQCWTSIERYYGITPCTAMSMLSESLVPAACEVDVTGALAMSGTTTTATIPTGLWPSTAATCPSASLKTAACPPRTSLRRPSASKTATARSSAESPPDP